MERKALGPSLVLLKNAISEDMQLWLATYASRIGETEWYTESASGHHLLNSGGGTRGRCYKALRSFPEHSELQALVSRLVSSAREVAQKLPEQHTTHMLVLYYATAEGMEWHRDSDPNDGNNDEPIVSISLGNSSDFGFKPLLQPAQEITLDSGDVLIWGGPQRMLEHCVLRTHLGTASSAMSSILGNGRVNFTFRSAPNILGREDDYASSNFWVDPGVSCNEIPEA